MSHEAISWLCFVCFKRLKHSLIDLILRGYCPWSTIYQQAKQSGCLPTIIQDQAFSAVKIMQLKVDAVSKVSC